MTLVQLNDPGVYHSITSQVTIIHELGGSWQNMFEAIDILMKNATRNAQLVVAMYFVSRTLYGFVSSMWMKYVIGGRR